MAHHLSAPRTPGDGGAGTLGGYAALLRQPGMPVVAPFLVETGRVDERAADVTTAGATGPVGLDLVRLARAESDLASVEQAMERLDAGTWGTCEHCGEALAPVSLEADPTARSCAGHA